MKKKLPLKKAKAVGKPTRLFAAFDCETESLIGDAVYVTWAPPKGFGFEDVYEAYTMQDFALWLYEWVNHPAVNGAVWYAHNMAFDMKRLLPVLRQVFAANENWSVDGIKLGYTGDKLYQIVVEQTVVAKGDKKLKLEFRDSMALMNPGTSLASFANGMQVGKKLKENINFEDGEIFDVNNEKHREYAKVDSTVLRDSLVKFNQLVIDLFGVELKATSSSTALEAWLVTLGEDEKYFALNPFTNHEIMAREAYKGGLVTLGPKCLTAAYIKKFDINSAYPYIMRLLEMPIGAPEQTFSYNIGDVGIYRCEISNVKTTDPSFLLTRTDSGSLVAPTGKFRGTFTSIELELLLTMSAAKVKVLEGLKYNETKNVFKSFVDKCETKRIELQTELRTYKKGSAEYNGIKLGLELIVKLMQNGVYGKFGTKREFISKLYTDKYIADELSGTDVDFYAVLNNLPIIKEHVETETPKYSLPHWAAFITAGVRCTLAKIMFTAGFENIWYTDTDSVGMTQEGYDRAVAAYPDMFIKSEANKFGMQYGFLKHEGDLEQFKVIAPKVYCYKDIDGHYGGAAKGIPRKAIKAYKRPATAKPSQYNGTELFYKDMLENIEELKATVFTYSTLSSFEKALINGDQLHEATRHLSELTNSSRYTVVDGIVYPKEAGSQKEVFTKYGYVSN